MSFHVTTEIALCLRSDVAITDFARSCSLKLVTINTFCWHTIGMTYQMVDDMVDKDPNAMKFITDTDIDASYKKASAIIDTLEPSVYVTSLKMLLDYIMAMKA